jgi:hypothetical protein
MGHVPVASNGTFTGLLVTAPGALPGSYAVTVLPTVSLQSLPSEAIYCLTTSLRQPAQPTDAETLPMPISVQPAPGAASRCFAEVLCA